MLEVEVLDLELPILRSRGFFCNLCDRKIVL